MDESYGQGSIARSRLLDNLKLVLAGAEQLLRASGTQAGENYGAAAARLGTALGDAPDSVVEMEQLMMEAARDALQAGDRYVRAHPWQAVGAGAAAGLALGLLLGRR